MQSFQSREARSSEVKHRFLFGIQATLFPVLIALPVVVGNGLVVHGLVAQESETDRVRQVDPAVTHAIDRMMQLIDEREPNPLTGEEPLGIHLIDTKTGKTRAVAIEPMKNYAHCGSPCWSRDGRRIIFDVSPGKDYGATRLQSIDIMNMSAEPHEFGLGNCPWFSPDGKQIVYLSNAAERGIWIMDADGENKRLLGGYGRPYWSPEGKHLLIASFGQDVRLTLMDPNTGDETAVKLEGYTFRTVPTWGADDQTIISTVATSEGRGLAMIDISDPGRAKVKKMVLDHDDIYAMCPSYDPQTDTYYFIGARGGNSLYSYRPSIDEEPQRMEPDRENESKVWATALSPDGRYLLFGSSRAAEAEQPGSE